MVSNVLNNQSAPFVILRALTVHDTPVSTILLSQNVFQCTISSLSSFPTPPKCSGHLWQPLWAHPCSATKSTFSMRSCSLVMVASPLPTTHPTHPRATSLLSSPPNLQPPNFVTVIIHLGGGSAIVPKGGLAMALTVKRRSSKRKMKRRRNENKKKKGGDYGASHVMGVELHQQIYTFRYHSA